MLDKFQRVASKLIGLQFPVLLATVICAIFIVNALVVPAGGGLEAWLMPVVVLLLWLLSLYSFIALFRHVPMQANPADRFFVRVKQHVLRGFYWLFLAGFCVVVIVSVATSFRLVTVWIAQ